MQTEICNRIKKKNKTSSLPYYLMKLQILVELSRFFFESDTLMNMYLKLKIILFIQNKIIFIVLSQHCFRLYQKQNYIYVRKRNEMVYLEKSKLMI